MTSKIELIICEKLQNPWESLWVAEYLEKNLYQYVYIKMKWDNYVDIVC